MLWFFSFLASALSSLKKPAGLSIRSKLELAPAISQIVSDKTGGATNQKP